jgi:hypothetical protein
MERECAPDPDDDLDDRPLGPKSPGDGSGGG